NGRVRRSAGVRACGTDPDNLDPDGNGDRLRAELNEGRRALSARTGRSCISFDELQRVPVEHQWKLLAGLALVSGMVLALFASPSASSARSRGDPARSRSTTAAGSRPESRASIPLSYRWVKRTFAARR